MAQVLTTPVIIVLVFVGIVVIVSIIVAAVIGMCIFRRRKTVVETETVDDRDFHVVKKPPGLMSGSLITASPVQGSYAAPIQVALRSDIGGMVINMRLRSSAVVETVPRFLRYDGPIELKTPGNYEIYCYLSPHPDTKGGPHPPAQEVDNMFIFSYQLQPSEGSAAYLDPPPGRYTGPLTVRLNDLAPAGCSVLLLPGMMSLPLDMHRSFVLACGAQSVQVRFPTGPLAAPATYHIVPPPPRLLPESGEVMVCTPILVVPSAHLTERHHADPRDIRLYYDFDDGPILPGNCYHRSFTLPISAGAATAMVRVRAMCEYQGYSSEVITELYNVSHVIPIFDTTIPAPVATLRARNPFVRFTHPKLKEVSINYSMIFDGADSSPDSPLGKGYRWDGHPIVLPSGLSELRVWAVDLLTGIRGDLLYYHRKDKGKTHIEVEPHEMKRPVAPQVVVGCQGADLYFDAPPREDLVIRYRINAGDVDSPDDPIWQGPPLDIDAELEKNGNGAVEVYARYYTVPPAVLGKAVPPPVRFGHKFHQTFAL